MYINSTVYFILVTIVDICLITMYEKTMWQEPTVNHDLNLQLPFIVSFSSLSCSFIVLVNWHCLLSCVASPLWGFHFLGFHLAAGNLHPACIGLNRSPLHWEPAWKKTVLKKEMGAAQRQRKAVGVRKREYGRGKSQKWSSEMWAAELKALVFIQSLSL